MALARFRFARQGKRSYGLCVKMTAVAALGMCFIFIWSFFSSSSSSLVSQRSTFGDIAEPVSANFKPQDSEIQSDKKGPRKDQAHKAAKKEKLEADLEKNGKKNSASAVPLDSSKGRKGVNTKKKEVEKRKVGSEGKELKKDEEQNEEVEELEGNDSEEGENKENEGLEGDKESVATDDVDQEDKEKLEDEMDGSTGSGKKKKKNLGPLFDPKAHYTWKLCSTRSKHNYIPCIDIESASGKIQSYRHHERSCPRTPPTCLVPLPHEGYGTPVSWPESKAKILYKNVAHPKLAAFIRTQSWVVESGEYLTFPQNQSVFKGGIMHYLESIEEMVPDIEWGKNVRMVLDIGSKESSFAAQLFDKDVLTLTLGLKGDLVDLAQVALERGFPAVVSPFGNRRLPFPSGVFDAIHCGECHISWHSNGVSTFWR
ncbi:hypothetical protein NMG60_11016281 [Bertholletia excelsa]